MKQTLMIHEFSKKYLKLPLEKYILTFDDGLYSQYCCLKDLKKIKTEKIFFISTGILATGKQSNNFVPCYKAHEKFFKEGNTEDYMNLEQIKELMHSGFEIGGHGNLHLDFRNKKIDVISKLIQLKKDTEHMTAFFQKELKIKPTKFCFPYNMEHFGYKRMLINFGYTDFFGKERIDINSLF